MRRTGKECEKDNISKHVQWQNNHHTHQRLYLQCKRVAGIGLDRRYLQPEDDIVQINWPDGWYIPTAQDLQLLVENTTVKDETINGNTWFRLTSTNGNSILIPGTGYIDDSDNVEKWATEAYLQSSTIGVYTSKPTIHALRVAKSGASLANSAGRPTGLMVRPVKYVRVD